MRDLFAEAGITPNSDTSTSPRDLFAETGVAPKRWADTRTPIEQLDAINGVAPRGTPAPEPSLGRRIGAMANVGMGMGVNSIAAPLANLAGVFTPGDSEANAARYMGKLGGFQPGSLESEYAGNVAQAFDNSKLAGLPVTGNEMSMIARSVPQAMPAVRAGVTEAGDIARSAGKSAAVPLRTFAENRMLDAMNAPAKAKMQGRDLRAVRDMLDNGLGFNKKSVETMKANQDTINSRIGESIAGSSATVSRSSVLNDLDTMGAQAVRTDDIAAIKKIRDDFATNPRFGDQIPVEIAQQYKVDTGKALKGQYGQQSNAGYSAEKKVAFNLKNQIADAVPGIGELNAADSALYNAIPLVERRVLANPGYGGLSWLIHNPKLAVAYLVGKSPQFKAFTANMANSAANVLSGKSRLTLPKAIPHQAPEAIPSLNPIQEARPLPTLDQLMIPGTERMPMGAAELDNIRVINNAKQVIGQLQSGRLNQAQTIQYLQQFATQKGISPAVKTQIENMARQIPMTSMPPPKVNGGLLYSVQPTYSGILQ